MLQPLPGVSQYFKVIILSINLINDTNIEKNKWKTCVFPQNLHSLFFNISFCVVLLPVNLITQYAYGIEIFIKQYQEVLQPLSGIKINAQKSN